LIFKKNCFSAYTNSYFGITHFMPIGKQALKSHK